MDKLDAKGKLKWVDIYNDRFGAVGDTLIQVLGNQHYYWNQFAAQTLEQLTCRCIERGCKQLIFAKNEFGMNGIDSIMYVDLNRRYSDKSKYCKIFINKCKIDEEVVKQSYKKAILSRELLNECTQSNLVKVEKILDKIKDESGVSVIDVINMACLDRYSDHLNVEFLLCSLFVFLKRWMFLFLLFFFGGGNKQALMVCARSEVAFDKHHEISCDNYKCFKLLIEQNDLYFSQAKLVVNKSYGRCSQNGSVMRECIKHNKVECVKLIIDYCRKYNLNFKNDVSQTYQNGLMDAICIKKGHKMMKLLLENVDLFDLNHQSFYGSLLVIPLIRSSSYNYYFPLDCDYKEYLDLIFEHVSKNSNLSIDVTMKDLLGKNIFDHLVSKNELELVEYIIEQGKNKLGWNIKDIICNYRNDNNETLFHLAVQNGSLRCLKYLLKLGLLKDINIVGGENNDTLLNTCISSTMYYDAVTYKISVNYKVFEFLLSQSGIDPNISNKFGYNAFDMCRRCKKLAYLKILNEWKQSKC